MARALYRWQKISDMSHLSEIGETQRKGKAHQKQRPSAFESWCSNTTWLNPKCHVWDCQRLGGDIICIWQVRNQSIHLWRGKGIENLVMIRPWLLLAFFFFFSSSPRFSWNPLLFWRGLLQVELFKDALIDCSTATGMNCPFMNFVPREHLFLFGALLSIDFDSNLSYWNKKERKLPINFCFSWKQYSFSN